MTRSREPASRWSARARLVVVTVALELHARLPGGGYARYLRLPHWAAAAIARGRDERAAALAHELLELAAANPDDWNHGNAIHHGHLALGRAALARDDLRTARAELLAAGRAPGSPQLCSFGPNMQLADDLLARAERRVVLEHFDLCRAFWTSGAQRLDAWAADVAAGRAPAFGANLVYGCGGRSAERRARGRLPHAPQVVPTPIAQRCQMRSVLHGFLGTYLSRYSDLRGYWLLGQIERHLGGWEVDILDPRSRSAASRADAYARRLATRRFGEQLSKHGLALDVVTAARVRVTSVGPSRESSTGEHSRIGRDFAFETTVTVDTGQCFSTQRSVFVAPHDPRLESRRSGSHAKTN